MIGLMVVLLKFWGYGEYGFSIVGVDVILENKSEIQRQDRLCPVTPRE